MDYRPKCKSKDYNILKNTKEKIFVILVSRDLEYTKGTNHKKNDKLDFTKIKNFCSSKDTLKKIKRQVTDENISKHVPLTSYKIIYRIYKELTHVNNKNPNNSIF